MDFLFQIFFQSSENDETCDGILACFTQVIYQSKTKIIVLRGLLALPG